MASPELEAHKVERAGLLSSFYYVPDFISEEEERHLMEQVGVDCTRQPRCTDRGQIEAGRWVHLSHRRLQVYPAPLSAKNVLLADKPIPDFVTRVLDPQFERLGVFAGSPHGAMNHVLVNEYRPGQGIMPHEDGDAYAPITATVSLGGHTVLDIYKKNETGERREKASFRLLQEGRSLLVTRDDAYREYLHGIEDIDTDDALSQDYISNWEHLARPEAFQSAQKKRALRVSLTCRDVLSVSKLGSKLFGKRGVV